MCKSRWPSRTSDWDTEGSRLDTAGSTTTRGLFSKGVVLGLIVGTQGPGNPGQGWTSKSQQYLSAREWEPRFSDEAMD